MNKMNLWIIGGLSTPNKMPCYSYNLPISTCGVGKKLAKIPGSGCFECYADKGFYKMPNVKAAMNKRKMIVNDAVTTQVHYTKFKNAFIDLLNANFKSTFKILARTTKPPRRDGRYFRWHDSGDLMSVTHLQLIADIAEGCPRVMFWLPTKEVSIVKEFLRLNIVPENLIIRISLPRLEQKEPSGLIKKLISLDKNIHYSYITDTYVSPVLSGNLGDLCPASTQDDQCKGCRRCWSSDHPSVGYILH